MLLDTHKMKAIDARNSRDWNPSDYDYDLNVFVYRIVWVSDGQPEEDGDLMTFQEVAVFLAGPGIDGEEELALADAQAILSHGGRVHVGPEDDQYSIIPLQEPMAEDRWGEIIPLHEAQGDEDCQFQYSR
ncbi:hypothetical protein [Pseudodesulfovibrio sediminis]|uniref:DUF4261 domain-containing protein n=1 Tax=Pseudodesulfovibrio sediminis TaxID=2810563 RepID=A0ABN6EP20_9BACT|nr:hypothetical protein [Pseudodesulfovibrio sediminis]BCS86841.1 hypothetical protein PSDVSF_00830 [Pseudodesulfovibrio sediminis]